MGHVGYGHRFRYENAALSSARATSFALHGESLLPVAPARPGQKIPVRRDLFRYYHSDAQSAVAAGHDIHTALLAFGCDVTHGYERTHLDGLAALSRLIGAYLLSPPVFASDARPQSSSLKRFSHQLRHDAQMESETRVPAVDSLLKNKPNA